jgi:hypothetical protein
MTARSAHASSKRLLIGTAAAVQVAPRAAMHRKIDDGRVAVILGFSRETIRRMSQELGIGQKSADAPDSTIEFTYEELYRLCRSSIRPV